VLELGLNRNFVGKRRRSTLEGSIASIEANEEERMAAAKHLTSSKRVLDCGSMIRWRRSNKNDGKIRKNRNRTVSGFVGQWQDIHLSAINK
jgi:hypothetical protein